jgi:hypothetical protein
MTPHDNARGKAPPAEDMRHEDSLALHNRLPVMIGYEKSYAPLDGAGQTLRSTSRAGGIRTHTGFHPEDFKSPASTIPPPPRKMDTC